MRRAYWRRFNNAVCADHDHPSGTLGLLDKTAFITLQVSALGTLGRFLSGTASAIELITLWADRLRVGMFLVAILNCSASVGAPTINRLSETCPSVPCYPRWAAPSGTINTANGERSTTRALQLSDVNAFHAIQLGSRGTLRLFRCLT